MTTATRRGVCKRGLMAMALGIGHDPFSASEPPSQLSIIVKGVRNAPLSGPR